MSSLFLDSFFYLYLADAIDAVLGMLGVSAIDGATATDAATHGVLAIGEFLAPSDSGLSPVPLLCRIGLVSVSASQATAVKVAVRARAPNVPNLLLNTIQ